MAEAEAARGAGHLDDHAGVHGIAERRLERRGVAVRHSPQHGELELAPDHRRDAERAPAALREPADAAADHVADALRDADLVGAGVPAELSLLDEVIEDLFDE